MARQQVTLTCPKYIQIRQMALLSLFYLVETSETHATFNSNASAVGETKISPSTRSVSSGGVTGSSFLHCHHSKRHHCGFRVQQKVWLPATSHKTSQNIKKLNPYSKIAAKDLPIFPACVTCLTHLFQVHQIFLGATLHRKCVSHPSADS